MLCDTVITMVILYRNERHNTWGKLSHKLTTEGDVFLGQKTIEVMTLGVAQDIWYNLGRYSSSNIVSSERLCYLVFLRKAHGRQYSDWFHQVKCFMYCSRRVPYCLLSSNVHFHT